MSNTFGIQLPSLVSRRAHIGATGRSGRIHIRVFEGGWLGTDARVVLCRRWCCLRACARTGTFGAFPATMTEAEQAVGSNPSSDIKDIVVMVVCVAIILAGMAWFMTYDWPSGKRPSVGEFILFW